MLDESRLKPKTTIFLFMHLIIPQLCKSKESSACSLIKQVKTQNYIICILSAQDQLISANSKAESRYNFVLSAKDANSTLSAKGTPISSTPSLNHPFITIPQLSLTLICKVEYLSDTLHSWSSRCMACYGQGAPVHSNFPKSVIWIRD